MSKVFFVDNPLAADETVYVVGHEFEADEIVFVVDHPAEADKLVYQESHPIGVDSRIYIVNSLLLETLANSSGDEDQSLGASSSYAQEGSHGGDYDDYGSGYGYGRGMSAASPKTRRVTLLSVSISLVFTGLAYFFLTNRLNGILSLILSLVIFILFLRMGIAYAIYAFIGGMTYGFFQAIAALGIVWLILSSVFWPIGWPVILFLLSTERVSFYESKIDSSTVWHLDGKTIYGHHNCFDAVVDEQDPLVFSGKYRVQNDSAIDYTVDTTIDFLDANDGGNMIPSQITVAHVASNSISTNTFSTGDWPLEYYGGEHNGQEVTADVSVVACIAFGEAKAKRPVRDILMEFLAGFSISPAYVISTLNAVPIWGSGVLEGLIEDGTGDTQQESTRDPIVEERPTQESDINLNTEFAIETPIENGELDAPSAVSENELKVLDNSNVRSGPGLDFEVVGSAQKDEIFTILEENAEGTWYKIELGTSRVGWIGSSRVDVLSP